MEKKIENYDVAVIGAGPAGMMAAGTAAEQGARVILIEKNAKPGRKLLITGNGRCNITNAGSETRIFIGKFGPKGKYLHSLINAFGVDAAMEFFTSRGLPLMIEAENDNKVFPKSDRASDVLNLLLRYMNSHNVTIKTASPVKKITWASSTILEIELPGETIKPKNVILCTGGMSYPETGSNGDGYAFAREMGHTIIRPVPALVPVILKEKWTKEIEGLSLRDAVISIESGKKKKRAVRGDAVFTANGMSGPAIYDLSKTIGEMLPGAVVLHIDFFPGKNHEDIDGMLLHEINMHPRRALKNSLQVILPASLAHVVVRTLGIDPDKNANAVGRDERQKLVRMLKDFAVTATGTGGFEKAIVTSGGISLDEIDMRTMRSRIISNLFFAGEIIDADGPTGGYNLQVCWSTGYVAGKNAGHSPHQHRDRTKTLDLGDFSGRS